MAKLTIDGGKPPLPSPHEFLRQLNQFMYLLSLVPAGAAVLPILAEKIPQLNSVLKNMAAITEQTKLDEHAMLAIVLVLGGYWILKFIELSFHNLLEFNSEQENDPQVVDEETQKRWGEFFQLITAMGSLAIYVFSS